MQRIQSLLPRLALAGAAALASLPSGSRDTASAQGYYHPPYGVSYSSYPASSRLGYSTYGYSTYGYRPAPGDGYVPYTAYRREDELPYDGTPGTLYYGHAGPRFYNPNGYGGDRAYGSASPNFGHAYAPYGYGTYSAYGY
jgi:hypothetical protein